MKRRKFLKYSAMGSMLLVGDFIIPDFLKGDHSSKINPLFKPDVEIDLRAVVNSVGIFNGKATKVWRYKAKVLKGPSDAVTNLPGNIHGTYFQS